MASPAPGISPTTRRALIVATSSTHFKKPEAEPTGCWAEEVAAPYLVWTRNGYSVDITTPGGAPVPWGASRGNVRGAHVLRRVAGLTLGEPDIGRA